MAKKQENESNTERANAPTSRTKGRTSAPAPAMEQGLLAPRRAARIRRAAAKAAEATCLEMPAAIALVKGCLGGTLPALGTRLGDLRPDPDARAQFCQCVADGAGVSRAGIPCGEGTTIGEVIDVVAC